MVTASYYNNLLDKINNFNRTTRAKIKRLSRYTHLINLFRKGQIATYSIIDV